MASKNPIQDDINKFLKASEELMKMGTSFSHGIDSAFGEFRDSFQLVLKSNFVEKGVAEMLASSFEKLESRVKANLECIDKIYTEGGQWYSFYLGKAVGKDVAPPPTQTQQLQAKGQGNGRS